MIQEIEIERVKNQVDFISLVANDYGLGIQHQGKDAFIKCPFHQDDTASLSIDPQRNIYHCFGCGEKGNVIQFVQKMDKSGFRDAYQKLSTNTSDSSIKTPTTKKVAAEMNSEDRTKLLEQSFQRMQEYYQSNPDGAKYLNEQRGITGGDQVGFCPSDFASKLSKSDRQNLKQIGLLNDQGKPFFSNCVVFPLVDSQTKIQSLYGRKVLGQGSHYYLPGPREGLFFHKVNAPSIIVVESVIDAQTLIENRFQDVLALYGVNGYTSEHEKFLNDYKIIHLLLDGDRTGKESAHKLSQRLKEKNKVVQIIELPDDEDPNSYLMKDSSIKWLKEKLLEALPKNEAMVLTEGVECYVTKGKWATYQLQGLNLVGFDKMKMTFKVALNNNPTQFYIDTIDLYTAKQRQRFAESIRDELGLQEENTLAELKTIIELLEKERLQLREEQGGNAKPVLSDADKKQALEYLQDKDLVENLISDFEACGTVGEEKGKLLGFLGTISRFLTKPLGVLIISRSGAGKTTLQESFCSFVPEEDLNQYTRISEKVLFYKGQDGLKNKVLALEEEDGMDDASYAIRTLQSSQKLTSSVTRSDPKSGKMVAEEYTVEGPCFVVISSTNPDALDYETRNRFIILTIDESEKQTKRIIKKVKEKYTLDGMRQSALKETTLTKYRNMQRLIKPLKVVNPYVESLEYAFDRLQMRREFDKYMTLINTVALFHQYQRPLKNDQIGGDYIEVTPEDIAIANDLVLEFFPNSTDELAPHTRNFLEVLTEMVKEHGGDVVFTRKQARDFSGWSNYSVIKAIEQLEELEYVQKVSGRNGSLIRYELLVDATQSKRSEIFLTDPKSLKLALK